MSETFKSGQWRICALCLGSIKPNDRATYISDEIACMACLASDETILATKEREMMLAYEALRVSNDEEREQQ